MTGSGRLAAFAFAAAKAVAGGFSPRTKNGTIVLTCAQSGPWIGVLYGASHTKDWCTGAGSCPTPARSRVLGSGAIASPGVMWGISSTHTESVAPADVVRKSITQ